MQTSKLRRARKYGDKTLRGVSRYSINAIRASRYADDAPSARLRKLKTYARVLAGRLAPKTKTSFRMKAFSQFVLVVSSRAPHSVRRDSLWATNLSSI